MKKMASNRTLGNVGEINIRRDLSEKGYIVADNDECDKSDLLVKSYINDGESPSTYFSLQAKYGGSTESTYQVVLITSSGNDENRTFCKYKRGDFDVFGIDFTESFGKVAYIPFDLVSSQENETLSLRITPPRNLGKPYWSVLDFLSIEKARNFKISDSTYKQRNESDITFTKMLKDLEQYIQFRWKQLGESSPYNNEIISLIEKDRDTQFPKWFKSVILSQINFTNYGEEPIIRAFENRSSNSTKIRSDLVSVPDKRIVDIGTAYIDYGIKPIEVVDVVLPV